MGYPVVANAAPWTDQMSICICDICAIGATGMAPERETACQSVIWEQKGGALIALCPI